MLALAVERDVADVAVALVAADVAADAAGAAVAAGDAAERNDCMLLAEWGHWVFCDLRSDTLSCDHTLTPDY